LIVAFEQPLEIGVGADEDVEHLAFGEDPRQREGKAGDGLIKKGQRALLGLIVHLTATCTRWEQRSMARKRARAVARAQLGQVLDVDVHEAEIVGLELGGSTTTCLTAKCNSTRSCSPSTLPGRNGPKNASGVSSNSADC
jgi:hypothetical protein